MKIAHGNKLKYFIYITTVGASSKFYKNTYIFIANFIYLFSNINIFT